MRYSRVIVDGVVRPKHVVIWESARGKVPPGYEIHHINGDGHDNRLENLVMLTKCEHRKLHAQLRRDGIDPVNPTDPNVVQSREYCKLYNKRHSAYLSEKSREYRQTHKSEIVEARRLHHERNRETDLAKMKAYYRKNKDHIVLRMYEYVENNRERISAYQKAYKAAHRDELRAINAAYREEHRLELNAKLRLRRAVKSGKSQDVIDAIKREIEMIKKGESHE